MSWNSSSEYPNDATRLLKRLEKSKKETSSEAYVGGSDLPGVKVEVLSRITEKGESSPTDNYLLLAHLYDAPFVGIDWAIQPEDEAVEKLRKKVDDLHDRFDKIQAALGIRSKKFPHVVRVAQETRNSWIADGLRIIIQEGCVKAGETKK